MKCAAHQDYFSDVRREARIQCDGIGQIRESADGDNRDLPRKFPGNVDEKVCRRLGLCCALRGRLIRVSESIFAVHEIGWRFERDSSWFRRALIDRNLSSRQLHHRQRIPRRLVDVGVAKHGRDPDNLDPGILHCQNNCHRVVDTWVAVDDDLSGLSDCDAGRDVKRNHENGRWNQNGLPEPGAEQATAGLND